MILVLFFPLNGARTELEGEREREHGQARITFDSIIAIDNDDMT